MVSAPEDDDIGISDLESPHLFYMLIDSVLGVLDHASPYFF